MINQSDKDSSQGKSKSNSSHTAFDSNMFFMYSHQTNESKFAVKRFSNPTRRIQIIISILLVVFTTLWVQITVQRHAPFIRTAQCFFNQAVFLHDSQDIYEGQDVIYWRNGQYYSFKDMKDMFKRLIQTSKGLQTDSFFQINNQFIMNGNSPQVQLLTIYQFDVPKTSHQYRTYNSSIEQMQAMLNSTLLNRTFYQHLWKIDLSIIVPLIYRGDEVLMQLEFQGQISSSALMQFKMDVDILTTNQDILNYGDSFSQNNLGVRKLNNNYDMALSMTYIKWIVLVLFVFALIFQMKFVLAKGKYIEQKVKKKLQEEHQMQKLLQKIDDKMELKSNDSFSSVGSFIVKKKQVEQQYQLPLSKKLQKIGYYYILQAIVTLLALMSFIGNQNGLICFFAWAKIVVYLAQTKNRLMFGFLFEQTIPTYLRIYLNIILFITAFVLFNMLVLTTTKKFQTIQLGYFQYFFNYFQYGIYQNFIFAFYPFGNFAAIFYFIQTMLLLYVGNNILISILANQVSKNSYLSSVEEMIDKIRVKCPYCGVDFQESRNNSSNNYHSQPKKEVMVSKLMRDLQLQKMRSYSSMSSNMDGEVNILIQSPVLSPFFPAKNQKRMIQDEYLSPRLKNRNLQNQMKQLQQKIKKQQINSESKLEAYQELKTKLQPNKKIQIELSDSRIEGEVQSKYHKKLRTKLQLLLNKVEKIRYINKSQLKNKGISSSNQKYRETKVLVLNDILRRIMVLEQRIEQKLTN